MGRFVVVEIGAVVRGSLSASWFAGVFSVGGWVEEGVSNVTPDFEGTVDLGRPEIVGAGSSSPSAALRDNWRAKSEACHHSRNLRAKMEVGSRILRLESRRGYTVCVSVLGDSSD